MPVPFGGHAPWCDPESPGGDDQRPVRPCKCFAEGLDGATIRIGGALKITRKGDLVLEGEVDHAVRCRGGPTQAVEIVERGAMRRRPRGRDRSSRGLRPSQPDDLVARADELGNNSGTDPAGSAGDEDSHGRTSLKDSG